MRTIHAVFIKSDRAQSAVGRLEVAGIPPQNISVSRNPLDGPRHDDSDTLVTAIVDDYHLQKAIAILAEDGRVEVANEVRR
ncbi:MAG TPA: hypothetical protein PKD49_15530 [Hyphomicrobium sp.]|nr:hypothetical protein [Hyphomicrobium sp.]